MCHHDGFSIMLDLSDAQGKIIKEFINFDADKLGNVGYGLTAGAIEKRGINRRTFETNVNELVKNNFLYLTKSEKHGATKSPWRYYIVSHFGVLAYFKWINKTKIDKYGVITKRFFPLITKHWIELKKIYVELLYEVLQNTTDQLSLEPQVSLLGKNQSKQLHSKKLVEKMTIKLGTIDVTLYRNIQILEIFEWEHNYAGDKIYGYSHNIDIEKGVTDRFTFVFYFNLINLGLDVAELLTLMLKTNPPFKIQNKKFIVKDSNNIKKSANKFQTKMKRNSNSVISIINNDPELHKLFKNTLDEIYSKMTQRKIIKHLQERIS